MKNWRKRCRVVKLRSFLRYSMKITVENLGRSYIVFLIGSPDLYSDPSNPIPNHVVASPPRDEACDLTWFSFLFSYHLHFGYLWHFKLSTFFRSLTIFWIMYLMTSLLVTNVWYLYDSHYAIVYLISFLNCMFVIIDFVCDLIGAWISPLSMTFYFWILYYLRFNCFGIFFFSIFSLFLIFVKGGEGIKILSIFRRIKCIM